MPVPVPHARALMLQRVGQGLSVHLRGRESFSTLSRYQTYPRSAGGCWVRVRVRWKEYMKRYD